MMQPPAGRLTQSELPADWSIKCISSFIEPIRDGVRKSRLLCSTVMPHYQRLIIIGLKNQQLMILTNQKFCYISSSAQGG